MPDPLQPPTRACLPPVHPFAAAIAEVRSAMRADSGMQQFIGKGKQLFAGFKKFEDAAWMAPLKEKLIEAMD